MDPVAKQPSIVLVPGSRRSDSLNVALCHRVARVARRLAIETTVLDMDEFALPIYDGDCEVAVGVPDAARDLLEALTQADVIILASPEYNNAPTPLLKNAIDWVTRVSKRPLEGRPVGLMSATPGSRGGVTGLAMLTSVMESLRVDLSTSTLPVGNARERLDGGDPGLDTEIESFLTSLVAHAGGRVAL